ncbi:MAG TPA: hypothetical protein VF773_19550 [Verrucomicrobiae bacterium]
MMCVGLKVFVLYSAKFGSEIGSRACRALRRSLGAEFVVNQSVWNAELLKSPKLRVLAAKEAIEADIVFVARAEGADLEPEMVAWLELWKKRGRKGGAALIALLERGSVDASHVVAEELHQFAKESKMDFFCLSKLSKRIPDEVLAELVN